MGSYLTLEASIATYEFIRHQLSQGWLAQRKNGGFVKIFFCEIAFKSAVRQEFFVLSFLRQAWQPEQISPMTSLNWCDLTQIYYTTLISLLETPHRRESMSCEHQVKRPRYGLGLQWGIGERGYADGGKNKIKWKSEKSE